MSLLPLPGVSVLFARSDSCYFGLAADCWDIERDARNYLGVNPVVCHPPCRAWGRLRHFAKPRPDEKALAFFAVDQVRRCGGVLEHPWGSTLWSAAGLPHPGKVDAWGGWTLLVDQGWWGHPAPKPTYLYIVGCSRQRVGPLPVQLRRAAGRTLDLSSADRERTPVLFARFLVALAAKCGRPLLQPSTAAVASICGTSAVTAAAVTADLGGSNTHLVGGPKARAAAKRAAFAAWASASLLSGENQGTRQSANSASSEASLMGAGMGAKPMATVVQPVPGAIVAPPLCCRTSLSRLPSCFLASARRGGGAPLAGGGCPRRRQGRKPSPMVITGITKKWQSPRLE